MDHSQTGKYYDYKQGYVLIGVDELFLLLFISSYTHPLRVRPLGHVHVLLISVKIVRVC